MGKLSLKAARVNAGLSTQDVQKHTGVARQTISKWECGHTYPNAIQFRDLCELYGVKMDDIFLPATITFGKVK